MEGKKASKLHKSSGKHKHKKIKKHKKERHSSDSDEGSVEMEWVEATSKPPEERRDMWMTRDEDEFVRTLTKEQMREGELSSRERRRRAEEKRKEEEQAVLRVRELNPHWSSGGSGLPEEGAEPVSKPCLPSLSVGDGGHAFLTKARIRIREQAEREGRSMEEVAVERWGSLSALDALIAEAEQRMHSHSLHKHREKDERSTDRPIRFQKPGDRCSDKCNFSSSRGRSQDRRGGESEKRRSHYRRDGESERRRSHERRGGDSERRNHDRLSSDEGRSKEYMSSCEEESPGGRILEKMRAASRGTVSNDRDKPRERLPAWKKAKSSEGTSSRAISRASPPRSPPRELHKETQSAREDPPKEESLNRLTARRMRAELAGDTDLAARLFEEENSFRKLGGVANSKDSLNRLAARRLRAELSGDTAPLEEGSRQERVLLTKRDSSGQQRPVVSSREDSGFERRTDRQQRRPNKYFDDSSKYSLKQMFEREKLTTTEDNLEMFLEVSAQCDDSKEENETSGISKRATQKMSHVGQEEKDIQKAMQQHQKLSSALERCELCLDQPNMKQHLIVDIQEQVFVCLPSFQSLVSGHCLVVPKRHVPSLLHLDEDEWKGLQDAVGSVRRVFRSQGKSLLLLETSLHFSRCPHAFAECIPLPDEQAAMAPLYFKKAILECEEEWAHNVKLVDLSAKGLRRSIPKNLPYFCVMFEPGVHGGYGHVIEDERAFPTNFGKEVVGGMLDIDYNRLYKNRREEPIKKAKEAADFTRVWEAEIG